MNPDLDWCRAVRTIAHRLFPDGFDVSHDAPNTYLDLAVHVARTGRYCVSSGCTDDPAFDSAETWQAFRAWHDWCHVTCGCKFTENGENEVAIIQECMLAARVGRVTAKRWLHLLQREVVDSNNYQRKEVEVA